MNSTQTLELLSATYSEDELQRILSKVMDVALSQHHQRLVRYTLTLHDFESRYGMDSSTFYQRFEAGELGDEMDFFEWASMYELEQALLQKISLLENGR